MAKKQSKRQRDIKTKLMAAICMLLVSSIMMVSSTYAWFTLSTAPEVTGINTAVGANGNLEMALLPSDGLTTSIDQLSANVLPDGAPVTQRNNTWGNLVDVSDNGYGLQNITLYPSALNLIAGADGADKFATAMLKTPVYGADGRIINLEANTFTGIYNKDNGNFTPDSSTINYGVRAVGTASGMTARQLSYRNAKGLASDAQNQAANKASDALFANGSSLANIAIKKGMDGDNAKFTKADLVAMQNLITALKAEDGPLDQIETAYMQYILAYAASNATNDEADDGTVKVNDTIYNAVKLLVETEGNDLEDVINGLATAGVDLPAELDAAIALFNDFDNSDVDSIVDKVNDAQTKLSELGDLSTMADTAEFTWIDISPILQALADPDAMKINGKDPSEVKENINDLVQDVVNGTGINVTISTGGGVFADIADQAGDYKADVRIDKVEYNKMTVGPLDAKMITASDRGKTVPVSYYLTVLGDLVNDSGAPISGETGAVPMTDMFGYIIDMAFRTNAADSELRLQADAVDRIYEGSTGVELEGVSTMGHGASMTFTSQSPNFGKDSVLKLMAAIRIVFFDPDTNEIIAYAKLDTAEGKYTTDAEGGITCKMYIYEMTEESITYRAPTGTEVATHVEVTTYRTIAGEEVGTHISDGADGYRPIAEGETGTHVVDTVTYREATDGETPTHVEVKTLAGETPVANNTIMSLTQNQAHKLSCLVYLDGNKITNADVAATGSKSVVGTMNLQFSSSAPLTPMNYTPLQNQTGTTEPETTTPETTAPQG